MFSLELWLVDTIEERGFRTIKKRRKRGGEQDHKKGKREKMNYQFS